jgi:hypothetical protein
MTVRFVPCLPRATPIHDIRKFSSKEAAQESARMTQTMVRRDQRNGLRWCLHGRYVFDNAAQERRSDLTQ